MFASTQRNFKIHKANLVELKEVKYKSRIIVRDFNTIPSVIKKKKKLIGKKPSKYIEDQNFHLSGIYRRPLSNKQETHSFQIHMEHSPKETILWAIKQASANSRSMKLHKICSVTTMELN